VNRGVLLSILGDREAARADFEFALRQDRQSERVPRLVSSHNACFVVTAIQPEKNRKKYELISSGFPFVL